MSGDETFDDAMRRIQDGPGQPAGQVVQLKKIQVRGKEHAAQIIKELAETNERLAAQNRAVRLNQAKIEKRFKEMMSEIDRLKRDKAELEQRLKDAGLVP